MLDDWNKGELDSFLIEISRDIFKFKDTDGKHLVDKIRDAAGQVPKDCCFCISVAHKKSF